MARAEKRRFRVVWSETYNCSKVVVAASREEALSLAYESSDEGTEDKKELDSTHDWGVIADDELNPPE